MGERDDSVHASAAAVLERRTEDVLAAFESALLSDGTAIAETEHGTAWHLDEARRTLTHVTAELRRGTYLPTGSDIYALEPGSAGGPGGARTHPADSRRAAAALFDAVVVTLLGGPVQERLGGAEMAVLLSLLHRSITGRHTDRSVAHIGHLLDRIHSAHNDERLRISRELHDEVAGQLGAALNSLELADLYRSDRPDRPERAQEKTRTAREQVQESLQRLREVMTGLRRHIDSGPLRGALLQDVTALGEHTADVRVTVTGDETWLPAGVAEELYLVVREALRNAVRHARARQVTVAVHVTPHEVRATVEDDGVGFDPRAAAPAGHSGIQTMRERTELLGGSLSVESRPGRGSRVRAFVPLEGPLEEPLDGPLKGEDDGGPG